MYKILRRGLRVLLTKDEKTFLPFFSYFKGLDDVGRAGH